MRGLRFSAKSPHSWITTCSLYYEIWSRLEIWWVPIWHIRQRLSELIGGSLSGIRRDDGRSLTRRPGQSLPVLLVPILARSQSDIRAGSPAGAGAVRKKKKKKLLTKLLHF